MNKNIDDYLAQLNLSVDRQMEFVNTAAPIAISLSKIEDGVANTLWSPNIYGLGVILTNHCLANCAHCYNNSSSTRGMQLKAEEIIRLVKWLKKDQPLNSVGLTGGEPLLYKGLGNLVHDLSELGINVSCSTGAVGVNSTDIHELAKNGLNELVVSWDAFHMCFAQENNLLSIITEACKLLPLVKVKVCVQNKSEIKDIAGNLDRLLPKKVKIEIHPLIRVGRAASLHQNMEDDLISSHNGSCASEFRTLSVNYDGYVYACCSVGGFTPALRLLHLDDLLVNSDIAECFSKKPLLEALGKFGWQAFEESATCKISKNKCVLCNKMTLGAEIHNLEAHAADMINSMSSLP